MYEFVFVFVTPAVTDLCLHVESATRQQHKVPVAGLVAILAVQGQIEIAYPGNRSTERKPFLLLKEVLWWWLLMALATVGSRHVWLCSTVVLKSDRDDILGAPVPMQSTFGSFSLVAWHLNRLEEESTQINHLQYPSFPSVSGGTTLRHGGERVKADTVKYGIISLT